MKKLLLVRYGDHENGYLNEQGAQKMVLAAEKVKTIVQKQSVQVISAKTPRAVESAEIISKYLNLSQVQTFSELYVAEESGVDINIDEAMKVVDSIGKQYDVVIAVVSREYIETLPGRILKNLGSKKTIETHLNRGEILILDYTSKDINYLR